MSEPLWEMLRGLCLADGFCNAGHLTAQQSRPVQLSDTLRFPGLHTTVCTPEHVCYLWKQGASVQLSSLTWQPFYFASRKWFVFCGACVCVESLPAVCGWPAVESEIGRETSVFKPTSLLIPALAWQRLWELCVCVTICLPCCVLEIMCVAL